jgi:cystatin-A/B
MNSVLLILCHLIIISIIASSHLSAVSAMEDLNPPTLSVIPPMREGGFKTAAPATPDIQAILDGVKGAVEERLGTTLPVFVAHTYSTQVVAGINYLVKVAVGDDKYIHVKVNKPLPHTVSSDCDDCALLTIYCYR